MPSVPPALAPIEAVSSLSPTVLLSLVAVTYIAYTLYRYRHGNAIGSKHRPDLWEPEGGCFLLGHLPLFLKNRGRFLELWAQWKEECPPGRTLSVTVPGRRFIDCSRPEALEYIQKTNFGNFVKGQRMHEKLATILGDGIFTVDGEAWHKQRKVTSKVFTPTLFRTAISSSISNNLTKLSSLLERRADQGSHFDLSDLFFCYTLSAFADFSFSTDVHALPADGFDETEPVPFASAFDEVQVLVDRRFTNPLWKMTEPLTGTTKAFAKANQVIDDFIYSIIDEREVEGKNDVSKEQKKEAQHTDLLSLYLALEDEHGEKLSKQQVRDSSLNLLLAGRDTTAEALSWCCYWLMKDESRSHWNAMRREVDELGEVTYDNHKDFVYTNAVFLEALRLHPSVPRNGWQTVADDQIPGGPRVEAGDTVFWSDWVMARDTSIWGKDAKEFNPARWIGEDGKIRQENQFKYHAFNGGYRVCLGQTLAILEAVSALAMLAGNFDLSLPSSFFAETEFVASDTPYATPRYRGALTLSLESPLKVQVARRSAPTAA
ncbi:hypothetical protein JCM10207_003533 [Rhodosporidiobolus poonsookiae]